MGAAITHCRGLFGGKRTAEVGSCLWKIIPPVRSNSIDQVLKGSRAHRSSLCRQAARHGN